MVDLRLWFQKRADARYISHLDLSRCMQRALKRSRVAGLVYRGVSFPHAYVTFALPLSLGPGKPVRDHGFSPVAGAAAGGGALRPLQGFAARSSGGAVRPSGEKNEKRCASAAYAVIFPGYAASLERLAGVMCGCRRSW